MGLWNKIAPAEQKLILGALAVVLTSGALTFTGHGKSGISVDTAVAIAALLRYVTDRLGAVVPTQAAAGMPPSPAPVEPVAPAPPTPPIP